MDPIHTPERFEDFFGHELTEIRVAAILLEDAREAFDDGAINESEFKELAADVLDFGKIDDLANTVDRKQKFKEAISLLTNLVEKATLIV